MANVFKISINSQGCKKSKLSVSGGEFSLPATMMNRLGDDLPTFSCEIEGRSVYIIFSSKPEWDGDEGSPSDLHIGMSLEVSGATKSIEVSIDKYGDLDGSVGIWSDVGSVVAGQGRSSRSGNLSLVR